MPATVISNNDHTKAILKKSLPLILMSGSDIASNFIRTLLITNAAGGAGLGATTIIYSITTFIIYPIPLLTSQDAVFIAKSFGKIKIAADQKLSAIQVIPQDNDQINSLTDLENDLLANVNSEEINIDKTYEEIGSFVRQGWLLAFSASVPSAIVLLGLNSTFVGLFNQSNEIENMAKSFIIPFSFSLPFQFMLKISERFMSSVDQEKWIIPYRLSTLAVESVLNYFLIMRYSLEGAGYAQVLKGIFALGALSIFFAVHPDFKKFKIYQRGLGDISYLKKILSQGLPMMLTQFPLVANSFLISTFVGKFGPSRLEVEQLMILYYGLLTAVNSGISESSNRLVSQYYGAENFYEMRQVGNIGMKWNALVFSAFALAYNIFSLQLAKLFISEDQIESENLEWLIRYSFMVIAFENLLNVIHENCRANLTSLGDTFVIAIVPLIVSFCVVLPLSTLSTYVLSLDLYGIIGAIGIGAIPGTMFVANYWFNLSKKVVENNSPVPTSNERVTKYFQSCNIKNTDNTTSSSFGGTIKGALANLIKRGNHPVYSNLQTPNQELLTSDIEINPNVIRQTL